MGVMRVLPTVGYSMGMQLLWWWQVAAGKMVQQFSKEQAELILLLTEQLQIMQWRCMCVEGAKSIQGASGK